MIYNFDLRTVDGAYKFLLDFLGMSLQEYFKEWVINSDSDIDKFWERNGKRTTNIELKDIRILAFHVVGSVDGCEEIRLHGLKNLKKVLAENTQLNRILKSYKLVFDIDKQLMVYKGEEYSIDYDWYKRNSPLTSFGEHLKAIAHRIYYDYCINGFLFNDDILSYGTYIHTRPEFMMKLSSTFPELEAMESEWASRSKSYKVNFYATIDQIHRFTFDLNETQEELTSDEIEQIKYWLVNQAINRVNNYLSHAVLIYINDEMEIPPEQIVNFEEIHI